MTLLKFAFYTRFIVGFAGIVELYLVANTIFIMKDGLPLLLTLFV